MFSQIRRLAFPENSRRIDRKREASSTRKAQRNAMCAARRARQRTWDSRIEAIYIRAKELRQWFDVVVDHIRPLGRGGKHILSNLQIIYRTENLRKGCRLDYTPSVVFT